MNTVQVLTLCLLAFDVSAYNLPTGGGRRRRELSQVDEFGRLLQADDFCCSGPNEFDFLIRDLDFNGKAIDGPNKRKKIPGSDVPDCIKLCQKAKPNNQENIDKCEEGCFCRAACPTSGFGSDDDIITEACRDGCAAGDTACQNACTDDCEERCESAYNDYVVPLDVYFQGIDILDCVIGRDGTAAEDQASCNTAESYWEMENYACEAAQGTSFVCECTIGFCGTGLYSCDAAGAHCPSEAPSETPTDAPTASPSAGPTASPSSSPTSAPSASPTGAPSSSPTSSPTSAPSDSPTPGPTSSPSDSPTSAPSASPSAFPTGMPTVFFYDVPEANDNYDSLGFDYESFFGGGCPNGGATTTLALSSGTLSPDPLPCGIPGDSIVLQCQDQQKVVIVTTDFDLTVYLKGGGGGRVYNLAGTSQPYYLTIPGNGAISQITFLFMCPAP